MVGESKRAAIRRTYRMLRVAAGKTQAQVEALARLYAGRYWKFENGYAFPNEAERKALARVLRVSEENLPSESGRSLMDSGVAAASEVVAG